MTDPIQTTAEAWEADAIPRAHAVHADAKAGSCESLPLPDSVARPPVRQKSPAQWAYERLVLYIQKFEESLDQDHEIGMGFAGSEAGMLHIQGMGFFAPDMITFYGSDPSGAKTQLVQHVSQLNVMLRALPIEKDRAGPDRIGFRLAADMESAADPRDSGA